MTASILLLLIGIFHLAHGLVDFVVYPADKRDVPACSQTNYALVKLCGQSRVQIYRSQIRQTTEFWVVRAIQAGRETILRIPGVDAVIEDVIVAQNLEESSAHVSMSTTANSTRSNKATRQLKLPIRYQTDAPQDLDLVSWPPRKRVPGSGMMLPFAYDVAKGVDTYIYIIDNGINKANAEFQSMPWPPEPSEWHYAYGVSTGTTDDDLGGHGSCVASKAAGWKTGVSKNSHLVVIKSRPTVADVNFAFATALDDIMEKNRQGKAVVLFPATSKQTFGAGSALTRNWRSVNELIKELFDQNVVVVTAAGNNAQRSMSLDTVPAKWALDRNFPLIVAGAVRLDGTIARFSQGAAEMAQIAWAPGDVIVCANGPSASGLVVRSGTSFAAGMVAGLAAYILDGNNPSWAPGFIPDNVRSRLLALSRPIFPLTRPNVIWNGLPGAMNGQLDNSTSQPLLQLVSNVTDGRAAVA